MPNDFPAALLQLTQSICAGQNSADSHLLTGSVLLPLHKADNGIRPIAIGEIIYRLAGRLISRCVSQRIGQKLKPIQYGVGVKGGAEIVIHALRLKKQTILADKQPNMLNPQVILSIDLINAFNSIRRHPIAAAINNYIPELNGFMYWAYSSTSTLNLQDHTPIASSQTGCDRVTLLGRSSSVLAFNLYWKMSRNDFRQ